MSQRRPLLIVLLLSLCLGAPRPAPAQLAGVQPVVEVGANLAHNAITATQSVITAIESVLQTANMVLELTPVEEVIVGGQIAEDMALLAEIVVSAELLWYDLQSLESQITVLFGLDNAPDTRVGLDARLLEIRQFYYNSLTFAMRTQTLVMTMFRTVEHVSRLIDAVGALIGNMQVNQVLIQTRRPRSAKHSPLWKSSKRPGSGPTQWTDSPRASSWQVWTRSTSSAWKTIHATRRDRVEITTTLIDDITAAFLAALATRRDQPGGLLPGHPLPLRDDYLLQRLCHGHHARHRAWGCPGRFGRLCHGCHGLLLPDGQPLSHRPGRVGHRHPVGAGGTGGTILTVEMIQKPSFIMTEGLKAAYPVADQASWFERIWASVKMLNKPGEMVAYWFVVLAFLAITTHHMMMLIEYHLAVMCAAVLIPWGLWSATSSVGEFAVGWLTGGFIRALVSTAMLGIALPLFALLNKPAEGFITLYNTVMLIGGAFIFAVLAWVIPARAAGIASRGMSLAVHGGALTAQAMTFARFGMMAQGAGAVATRAHSRMMAARQMAQAGP